VSGGGAPDSARNGPEDLGLAHTLDSVLPAARLVGPRPAALFLLAPSSGPTSQAPPVPAVPPGVEVAHGPAAVKVLGGSRSGGPLALLRSLTAAGSLWACRAGETKEVSFDQGEKPMAKKPTCKFCHRDAVFVVPDVMVQESRPVGCCRRCGNLAAACSWRRLALIWLQCRPEDWVDDVASFLEGQASRS
jgi:hypothetical protein